MMVNGGVVTQHKSCFPGGSGGGACSALVGVPFLVAGLFVSRSYFTDYYGMWWTAQSWQKVPCWIDSVQPHEDGNNTNETTVATYNYVFDGQSYDGDRVSLYSRSGDNTIGDFQAKAYVELSRYVVVKGEEVSSSGGTAVVAVRDDDAVVETKRRPFRCYVNPKNPSESVIYRIFRYEIHALHAIAALIVPILGVLFISGGLFYSRYAMQEAALTQIHVGEPWKWKLIWVRGVILEKGHGFDDTILRYALVFISIWSSMIIFPLIVATTMTGAFLTDRSAWWLMTYVILWYILALCTYKIIRHWLTVGGSTILELEDIPVSPGGVLHGSILLTKSPLLKDGVPEVRLVCEKHVTHGSGDSRKTDVEKIWSQQDTTVSQDRIIQDVQGIRLPVSIALPADALESSLVHPRMLPAIPGYDVSVVVIIWKLKIKIADTPFKLTFEIPVFRTATSPVMTSNEILGVV